MSYRVVKTMSQFLDKSGERSIDLDYILEKIQVNTPYGKNYKEKLKPFIRGEEKQLEDELNKVEKFVALINEKRFSFINLKNIFTHIKDLKQSMSRCIEGYVLTEVELFEVKNFVILLEEIKKEMDKISFWSTEDMEVERIYELEKLFDPRGEGLKTFYIYDEYSDELSNIRKEKRAIEKRIKKEKNSLRENIQKNLGIKINANGTLMISKADIDIINKIEQHSSLTYNSETYMNIKYSIKSTDIVDYLEKEMDNYKNREENEEFKIRNELSKEVAKFSRELFRNMEAIGWIDLTIGKAYFAININGVKPDIKKEHSIIIEEGRHLKVEEALMEKQQEFTPITAKLKEGVTCITGANMGGKTISLKLVGMLSAMAQYGFFVPCKKMVTGLHGFIHISIGDWQSSDQGLSTFGAEIKGIQEAIKRVDEKGLILIDELARGTNPEEGYAISNAIVNYLKDKECITLITTHYDNVANGEDVTHLQVVGLGDVDYEKLKKELKYNKNYGIDVVTQYMDYRLKEVNHSSEVPRDAINIARLMGLEEEIISYAERKLEES